MRKQVHLKKKSVKRGVLYKKISFIWALVVIPVVVLGLGFWLRDSYMASQGLLSARAASSIPPASQESIAKLEQLRDVSCEIYEQLVQDKIQEVCDAQGACERSPEKFRKNCVSRIPKAIEYCIQGNNKARGEILAAFNAMNDHLGLRVHYCRTNQIDCNFVAQRLGAPWITGSDLLQGTFAQAREAVKAEAKSLGRISPLPQYPMALYADMYARLQQGNVCL